MLAPTIFGSMLLPILAMAEVMAKIKINLPDSSTYRDYYNYDDFVWGGDSKEIEFSQTQITDEFAIKFKWITWADTGGDYTHGSSVWNMTCYAQSTATYIGTAEWTLSQDKENPITGTANSPGRVWCPADQGECRDGCVDVDSVSVAIQHSTEPSSAGIRRL
ncbi:hypothetical protein I203_105033 [Kwoniella mangroviensis CBS 8507]|uniref:uncharacterized protein n=1 Tax=Kwoniella mangroviensis CBS 8507 TaxID=1296122 RepID=UPI00080CE40D|nr:uncharacterized protein I203_00020 [Kwoniella mangroviensis CBS 8507]OCF69893.1 hypothetical protein I203_00020 [Kwoniella mangroviensis CBS 8507]